MTDTILLVDDNQRLLSGARLALEMNGFTVLCAANGDEALSVMEKTQPSLIVSDILMPGCDGFSLLEKTRARPEWVTIPFLFLSALDDQAAMDSSRALGADDYLTKPFTPRALVRAVRGKLDRALALRSAHFSEAYLQTILVLARAIESRDRYTGRHIERVAEYASRLARALGWSEAEIAQVHQAAVLHDVGKVSIPDAVLNKAAPLSEAEWAVMKEHPARGVEILAPLAQHQRMALEGVRHHHEQYDGRGYPDGLAGEAIPPIGRLLAIADAYDAMTSDRPYRPALTAAQAAERMRAAAGVQFDPHFVSVFLAVVEQEITSPASP